MTGLSANKLYDFTLVAVGDGINYSNSDTSTVGSASTYPTPQTPTYTHSNFTVNATETQYIEMSVHGTVTDGGTLTYAWYKGTTDLGNSSETLTIASAGVADAGSESTNVIYPPVFMRTIPSVTFSTLALADQVNAQVAVTNVTIDGSQCTSKFLSLICNFCLNLFQRN